MENENPSVYAVRFLPVANRDLDSAFVFVADTSGKDGDEADEYAREWWRGLLSAVGTLASFPLRYAVVPEADLMARPSVRSMPYRQMPGGPVWRVLYRVFEADENDPARVEIAAILHGAQKPVQRHKRKRLPYNLGEAFSYSSTRYKSCRSISNNDTQSQ